jgi:hypothetical protein
MERLIQGKGVWGVTQTQVSPLRPGPNEILVTVGRAFGVLPPRVLERSQREVYQAGIY